MQKCVKTYKSVHKQATNAQKMCKKTHVKFQQQKSPAVKKKVQTLSEASKIFCISVQVTGGTLHLGLDL